MNKLAYFYLGFAMLFMVSCNSRKNSNDLYQSAVVSDSMHSDTLYHPLPDELLDGHIPPPPPPDGKHFDGPPPPPPHGKDRPPHEPDNMRGFDPASEDDMEDNGMSRYIENNDEEGWD